MAKETGAKTATAEYRELLRRPDIEGIFVCTTPEDTHFPIARDCLLARKHTLLEKPMGLALKEADELLALSAVPTGAAGGIYAFWTHYIEPADVFDVPISVRAITMALIGGTSTVAGPLLGAILAEAITEALWRRFLLFHAAFRDLVMIVIAIVMPRGHVG